MVKILKFIASRMNKSSYRFFFTTLGIKITILRLAFSGFYSISYNDVNRRWDIDRIYYILEHFSKRGYMTEHRFNTLKISWVDWSKDD